MAERGVYLVECELSGESQPLRKEGYAGAFVVCFVVAAGIRNALDQAEAMLTEDGYQLLDVSKVMRFEPSEWEGVSDICALAAEVAATGESAYSDFEVWGH